MTVFTITLKTDNAMTKHEAYAQYGNIADVCSNLDLVLVEITDDVAATVAPSEPVKTRKPRGPNKAKVHDGEVGTVTSVTAGNHSTDAGGSPAMDIPAALRRA